MPNLSITVVFPHFRQFDVSCGIDRARFLQELFADDDFAFDVVNFVSNILLHFRILSGFKGFPSLIFVFSVPV